MEFLLSLYIAGVIFNYIAVLYGLFFNKAFEIERVVDLFILLFLIFLSWGWEILAMVFIDQGESSK
jgi:hypothetical protein